MKIQIIVSSMLCLLMAFIAVPASYAAEYREFFHTHTGTNVVVSMAQDSEGVLWLATTKGVMRYEDLGDPLLCHSLYPKELRQAALTVSATCDGRLWIKMLSNKMYIYNPSLRKIEEIDNEWLRNMGIDSEGWWKTDVVTTDSGLVWFVTDKKVYSMDIAEGGKPIFVAALDEPFLCVSSDRRYLHVVTRNYIYTFDGERPAVKIKTESNDAGSGRFRVVLKDRDGNLWGGGHDLFRYGCKEKKWERIGENVFVSDIVESATGEIIVGSYSSGIICYDTVGNRNYTLEYNPYNFDGITSGRISRIYIDKDENLLVCYTKGGFSISSLRNNVAITSHIEDLRNRNVKDDIISLACTSGNSLLLGTDGNGLYEVDAATGKSISSRLGDAVGGAQAVTAIFIDSKSRRWVGRFLNGALRMDADGSIRNMLPGSSPYSFEEDEEGMVYAGLSGSGLYRLQDSREPERIDLSFCKYMQQLECNKTGSLYVAMSDGLMRLDVRTGKAYSLDSIGQGHHKLANTNIISVLNDSRNLLWVVGRNEEQSLEVVDIDNDTIMTVPQLKYMTVRSIIEDNNNSIWLASESDIHNIIVDYDIQSKRYRFRCHTYRFKHNGLQPNYNNPRAVAKLNDGNLVFGGVDGYRIINPAALSDVALQTDMAGRFTSMRVNNRYIVAGMEYEGNVILKKDIAYVGDVELESFQNNIGISFFPFDYASPLEIEYYYSIDGKGKEWLPLKDNVAQLSNLLPGEYVLRIKGKKTDGTLSDDVARLGITIKSPWYLTPWAYAVYFIVFCLVFWIVTRYFIDRQKQKLRIVQAEKEIERQHQANEMKLRFFTNVSHDFRTPLSLIITPLETYLSEPRDERDRRFIEPVYRNAVRLLNFVNQILDFRKLETYGSTLNLSYGDMVGFIRDICASFTLFSEEKK